MRNFTSTMRLVSPDCTDKVHTDPFRILFSTFKIQSMTRRKNEVDNWKVDNTNVSLKNTLSELPFGQLRKIFIMSSFHLSTLFSQEKVVVSAIVYSISNEINYIILRDRTGKEILVFISPYSPSSSSSE